MQDADLRVGRGERVGEPPGAVRRSSSTTRIRWPSGAAPASTASAASTIRSRFSASLNVGRMSQGRPGIAGRVALACRRDGATLRTASIAAALDELGDLYELDGAIVHRVVAYRSAAKAMRESPRPVAALVRCGTVTELPGIGKTLEEKLAALARHGDDPGGREAAREVTPGRRRDDAAPRARAQARAAPLRGARRSTRSRRCASAAEAERIRDLKGFGPKAETSILEALDAGAGDGAEARACAADGARDRRARSSRGLRVEPAVAARRARRVAHAGRWTTSRTSTSSSRPTTARRVVAAFGDARGRRRRASAAARAARAGARRTGSTSTCGSCRRRRSATCCSTSAARRPTTCTCARWRCAAACTSPSTASSTTRRARPTASRPRRRSTAFLGLPYVEPELREDRGELEPGFVPPRLVTRRGPARRPALPHRRLRREGHDRGDGARGARARTRVPRDHRPLREPRVRRRRVAGRRCAATPRRSGGSARVIDGITLLAGSEVNVLPGRLARLRRRAARRARLGHRERPHGLPAGRRRR